MRIFLVIFITLSACSTLKQPVLTLVSPRILGQVDSSLSIVRLYPADDMHEGQRFFLELININKQIVDIEDNEVLVKDGKKIESFQIQRNSLGRYQLIFEREFLDLKKVKFIVQGHELRHELISYKKPFKTKCFLKVMSQADHEMTLQLTLRDKQGESIETQGFPEVILEGLGEVTDLKYLKKGVWEFIVGLPEENQILYLSIRANGVQLERLFRFQHIEK